MNFAPALALIAGSIVTTSLAHADINEFELCQIEQRSGRVVEVEAYGITLGLDGFSARGSSGCNEYDAEISRRPGRPVFEQISSTQVACEDEARMAMEDRYMRMLGSARSLTLADGTLVITSDKGNRWVFAQDCEGLER